MKPSPGTPGEGLGEGSPPIANRKSKIENTKALTPALSPRTGREGRIFDAETRSNLHMPPVVPSNECTSHFQ